MFASLSFQKISQIHNMKHLIVFVFISAMCFGLNEACNKICNRIVIRNWFDHGQVLLVKCKSNWGRSETSRLVASADGTLFVFFFNDHPWPFHTRWDCNISYRDDNHTYYYDLEAYHSNFQRCDQLREWIGRDDGIWFTRSDDYPVWVLPWKLA